MTRGRSLSIIEPWSQLPWRIAIAANFGNGEVFDRAMAWFAEASAYQNHREHDALQKPAASGSHRAELPR